MKRFAIAFEIVHVVALSLWIGAVVMAGLAAAIVFPTMRSLEPRLATYPDYTGDHWMLAAGKVAARIFHATDIAQGVCAVLAVVSAAALGLSGAISYRRPAGLIWLSGLAASVGVLAASLLWLRPRMDASLHAYWDAAMAGNNPVAEAARQAFSADHPLASNLMAATAACVLATLVAHVVAARTSKPGGLAPSPNGADAPAAPHAPA
ncbi:MAG: hypothetical protein KDA05_01515 [Phycisphaerales bacterium]|nr:hypothetical protein [Phycisphaerales bacterium]